MKKPNRYSPRMKHLSHIFCVVIGVTFILSGFSKAIDPWGTAIKFNEYFALYGLNFLLPLTRILAVWLCGAELMMGCMILFRVRLRLISIFALVSMVIFTIVTALSVSMLPVEDCGCFGEILYLTPKQTLIKNLILLPMVITIWWRYRPDKILVYKPREVILATIFCSFAMGFSAYNYLHLPMINTMPYKVGADLLGEIESPDSQQDNVVVLIYRNIASGELHEFSIEDTQWQNSAEWEWVETKTKSKRSRPKSLISDFVLLSHNGVDQTIELLSTEGNLNILTITSIDKMPARCRARIEKYIADADLRADRTIIITPEPLDSPILSISNCNIECYNIDATTMNSVMRASVGVLELHNGVITSRRSCIDL